MGACIALAGCRSNDGGETDSTQREVSGYVYDASFPVGVLVPIVNATVQIADSAASTNINGFFALTYVGGVDTTAAIAAPGFHSYTESVSRMENGAFYLIPSGQVYQDVSILIWEWTSNNNNNRHRKWTTQTEFYVVKNKATDAQVQDLIRILMTDEYRKLTGGRFHSNTGVTILDSDPGWSEEQRHGKTKIYFQDGIIEGGVARSDSEDGTIKYAEIGWDTQQHMDEIIVWHEVSHTVTAGGHINYRPSVNSEVLGSGTGHVTTDDERAFNAIYSSPPLRSN